MIRTSQGGARLGHPPSAAGGSMSLLFEFFYLIGFHPWDRGDMQTPQRLRDAIEGPARPEPGRALDIGCGMGRHSIYLAQQGWQVTGVDEVERALRVARR